MRHVTTTATRTGAVSSSSRHLQLQLNQRTWLLGLIFSITLLCLSASSALAKTPFAIKVVDEATNRGVPLVQLTTVNHEVFITDSNGYIAITDPVLMNQKVYFSIFSHGYDYPKDGFGGVGVTLNVKPGGEEVVKIKRINIAERLYRITGAGIYRDSVILKKSVPIKQPLLNAEVTGQDTVQAVVMGNQIRWFWGDTNRLAHYLGQFNTSGAVSKLPGKGGLDPDRGVNLEYFVNDEGFSRSMFDVENGILIWVGGIFVVDGPDGKPRMITNYDRRKSLSEPISTGLAVLNEKTNIFEPILEYQPGDVQSGGQAFKVNVDGEEYIYFANPYAYVRVKADWKSATDPKQWESFTPLKQGSRLDIDQPDFDRSADGKLNYTWKKDTSPITRGDMEKLVKENKIKNEDNWFRTQDASTGKDILLHVASIRWNPHRERWVMIAEQTFGESSFLGEIWYSEAKTPEGPFEKAVQIITHKDYSFYNVTHHDFFDQEGGRIIYFEGTYTNLFTKDVTPTPLYEYNQIMYRLNLDDARLQPAFAQ